MFVVRYKSSIFAVLKLYLLNGIFNYIKELPLPLSVLIEDIYKAVLYPRGIAIMAFRIYHSTSSFSSGKGNTAIFIA